MVQKVILDDVSIDTTNFHEETAIDEASGRELRKIRFDFKVTSNEYHEITTLLYGMNFQVKVPGKNLEFPATIHSYSTSITDLYKENEVGDFKLELISRCNQIASKWLQRSRTRNTPYSNDKRHF